MTKDNITNKNLKPETRNKKQMKHEESVDQTNQIKRRKNPLKGIFISFLSLILLLIVACGGVVAFAHFKYNINAITLINNFKDIKTFKQSDLTLTNAYSDADLSSIESKLDNHDFSENVISFTDKEIAAMIDRSLDENIDIGFDANFLELKFSNYDESDKLVRLSFVVCLDMKELKEDKLSKFPLSIFASQIPNELYLSTVADVISGKDSNTSYTVNSQSLQVNGLSLSDTEHLFRLLELVSKEFNIKTFGNELGSTVANAIIGNDKVDGIYTSLQEYGAKGYLFNSQNDENCFSIYAHTIDEERTITYLNTKNENNSNPTIYTLKDGVITLSPLESLGYNFLGWYDADNNLVETIKTVRMENYNLTAKWETITYTITYKLKGGTVSESNPTEYTIETEDFTLNNPTKEDDEFVAWSGTNLTEESYKVTIKKGTTGNLIFTAHFLYDEVYMTFCIDGVEVYTYELENNTVLTKDLVNEIYSSENCGMIGYNVEKWYSNTECTTEYEFDKEVKRDFTIYSSSNYFINSILTPANLIKFKSATQTKSLTILNHNELVSWVFYVMFYNIGEDCQVKLDLSKYIENSDSKIMAELDLALNDVGSATTYQCGAKLRMLASNTYGIIHVSSSLVDQFASKTLDSSESLYTQYGYAFLSEPSETRPENFTNFNIDNIGNCLEVTNSEQLVYALEMGFNPICVSGSSAETVYNKAKSILKSICHDKMTNMEKAYAIYSYLVMNVQYDNLAASKSENGTISAEETRAYDSWFAEGVFNSGKAVCEGFAKAFLIMAKIENIPTLFVTGNNHAWNKIYVNNAWYGIDATQGNIMYLTGKNEILSFANFLFTDAFKQSAGYTTTDHADIVANTVFDFYDQYYNLTYNEIAFDLIIDSTTELNLLLSYIKANLSIVDGITYYTFECVLPSTISTSTVVAKAGQKGLSLTYLFKTQTNTGSPLYTFSIRVA